MASRLPIILKAVVSLILPAVALVISFGLAIAAALSPRWAQANLFPPTNDPVLYANRTHHRGVFYECVILDASGTNDPLAAPAETCTRYKMGGGNCGSQYNTTTGVISTGPPDFNQHLCQQLEISGKLLVASIVLVGVGVILAIVIAGASWRGYTIDQSAASPSWVAPVAQPSQFNEAEVGAAEEEGNKMYESSQSRHQSHRQRHHQGQPWQPSQPTTLVPTWLHYLTHPARLIIALGTVCLFITELLAVNSLVNDASPNSDFMTGSASFGTSQVDRTGSWYMDKAALSFMPASWVFSGLGVWVACWGWV